jgi:hypothetical protein
MIQFCEKHHIILNHSTTYYPQGNGLVESSNKSLVIIIKKLLEENKKAWHLKLKYALWANKISTKRSIGTSPFQLVYGTDVIFLVSLGIQVLKYLQTQNSKSDSMQNRINHLIELQELQEEVYYKSHIF